MFKAIGKLFENKEEPREQAILIHLDGVNLDDSVYAECDTMTLEDQLTEALGGEGEVDGSETGDTETTVFLYGSDAEKMFSKIKPVLASYPLCKNARVVIRHGQPGSPQREIQL